MTEQRPTRRRWFQFSLRTFLVVILLVGLGCGWVGMQLQQKRRHEAVANEIVKVGGSVYLEDVEYLSVWKEWLFGSYAVQRVALDLDTKNAIDSLLAQTQGMNLTRLNLSYTKVTDAGLIHLKGSTNLAWLSLYETRVTDAGLTHLEGLTRLNYLELYNTQVTDAGLVQLNGMTSLAYLDLDNTQVTDAGLAHLKGLASLKSLTLFNTQVTQAGVDKLQQAIPG